MPSRRRDEVPPLLTRAEVAEHLGVSPRTVRRMMNEGMLPCVRLGRKTVRVLPADLTELIRRRAEYDEGRATNPALAKTDARP